MYWTKRRGAKNSLELELQVVVRCLTVGAKN